MKLKLLLFIHFFIISFVSLSHSVQVVWCQSCQGVLRLYVEHWHGSANPSSTTMTLSVTVNGNTTTTTGSPVANLQGLDKEDLPNCASLPTTFTQCGKANTERDWVVYDFPSVPTGVPVEITVLSGNNAFTADCGGMYPASTGVIVLDNNLQQNVILNNQALCGGEAFDAQEVIDSLPNNNFSWTNSNTAIGLPASGNGYIPSFNALGNSTTQTANITLNYACFQTTMQVVVNPNPVSNFLAGDYSSSSGNVKSGNKCEYDSVLFQNTSITSSGSITSFKWDFGNSINYDNIANPKVKFPANGTYDVQIMTENSFGCKDTLLQPITIYPKPVAVLKSLPECLNKEMQFLDSSFIDSPDFIESVLTNFGDLSSTSTLMNPSHLYPQEGLYTVSYRVESNHGCIDSTSIEAEVYAIPTAEFMFDEVCENTPPTHFTNLSTIANGSIITQIWEFDDDNNNTSNSVNVNHFYRLAGYYDVSLKVFSDNGCEAEVVKNVWVKAKPNTIFFSNITEACKEACVQFFDYTKANANSIQSWEWIFGNESISSINEPFYCFLNESNTDEKSYDVSLYTTNDIGCSDSIFVSNYINVWHNPKSIFEAEPPITDMHHPEVSFLNYSIGADFYSWDFENGFENFEFEPTHKYSYDSARYPVYLAVETIHGCKDTSSITYIVEPVVTIYVPNSFTPNGDGVNDVFFFKDFGIIEELLRFEIFDRWGNLVYSTNSFTPWDGMTDGVIGKEDVYIYKLKCIDVFQEIHELKGHVSLLK